MWLVESDITSQGSMLFGQSKVEQHLCWLVEAGLGSFSCDLRISRLFQSMPVFFMLFEDSLIPCCLRMSDVSAKSHWLFCSAGLLIPDGAVLYLFLPLTWFWSFHTFQVGSLSSYISILFISNYYILHRLI